MRYAIIGSGAVGGLYGGMLARRGHDVHFLLHSDFEHVAQNGLRVDSVKGDFVLSQPRIYRDVADMPRCDCVIVTLKSTNNGLLESMLPRVLAAEGVVLTLQNGLDVEADSVHAAPDHGVLGGCCFLCSNKVGPGHIRHLDYGRIVFGVYNRSPDVSALTSDRQPLLDHAAAIGKRILSDMTESGIEAVWTDDLGSARWRKLMWNIPFNGLSVVLDTSTDELIASSAGKTLANTIIAEVHRGAGICGIEIDPSAIEATMRHTETMVPYDSSMRLDFLNGRPMEVAAIFGNPIAAVRAAMGQKGAAASDSSGSGGANAADAPKFDTDPIPHISMLHHQLQFLDSRPPRQSNPRG